MQWVLIALAVIGLLVLAKVVLGILSFKFILGVIVGLCIAAPLKSVFKSDS